MRVKKAKTRNVYMDIIRDCNLHSVEDLNTFYASRTNAVSSSISIKIATLFTLFVALVAGYYAAIEIVSNLILMYIIAGALAFTAAVILWDTSRSSRRLSFQGLRDDFRQYLEAREHLVQQTRQASSDGYGQSSI